MNYLRRILLIALIPILTAYIFVDSLWLPNVSETGHIVFIPAKSTATIIIDSLEHAGVIRNAFEFHIALKVLRKENALLPGVYEFKAHQSNAAIIDALSHTHSAHHVFITFPEGMTVAEYAHIGKENLVLDSGTFVALAHDSAFMNSLGIHAPSLEGYLCPETYEIDSPVRVQGLLARMIVATKHFFTDSLRQRCSAMHLTEAQLLTLASIVESETADERERQRIAGVYWNRLRVGMRLEADPTIQYALGERRHLYYKDLAIESPYNTYLHVGLPPTPINNPSKASIFAALYPEHNPYLYFVARGDSTGLHRFSETLQQQTAAVENYRRTRRKQ
jgi:UPF0755 protein